MITSIFWGVGIVLFNSQRDKNFESRLDRITGRNQADIFQIIEPEKDDINEILYLVWNKVFQSKNDASKLWNKKLLTQLTTTDPMQLPVWRVWNIDDCEGQHIIDNFLHQKMYSQNAIERECALHILSQRDTANAKEFTKKVVPK